MNFVIIKNDIAVNIIVCDSLEQAMSTGADDALELNDENMNLIKAYDVNNVVSPKSE